jgi:pyridoxal phosphate enzyme (YggS family)
VSIKENVGRINDRIASAQIRSGNEYLVKIVAITKTRPADIIVEAHQAGLAIIGENRIQEAERKFAEIPETLPKLTKRLVGHLQSNKIKKALSLFDTIDSVDSLKLATKIGAAAIEQTKRLPILLEVNTSGEESKFGFNPQNIDDMLACGEISGIELKGLMTIGPLTSDKKLIRQAFISLRKLHYNFKRQLASNDKKFTELSMGMSGDFEVAVEEGSTMVRLGTVLFGKRKPIR